jgi:hypothetical protein
MIQPGWLNGADGDNATRHRAILPLHNFLYTLCKDKRWQPFFWGSFSRDVASESCCDNMSMVKKCIRPLYLAYVMIGEGRKNRQQLSL